MARSETRTEEGYKKIVLPRKINSDRIKLHFVFLAFVACVAAIIKFIILA